MTFLNPLVLFGLAAAAIPILLHLFNLRKLRTIEFSTLSFLKELQKTKIRRLKIRQLLLLILRTLLIIFVVLAFSRPTLQGSIAARFGSQAKTTAVFIVDNSLSMTGIDERGELLKQAKDAALGAVDLLKDGDEVFLLPLSNVNISPSSLPVSPTRNFVALKSAIRDIRSSPIHRSLEDALRLSSKLLSASSNFNREVYLFSDFQAGGLIDRDASERPNESLFPLDVRFYFARLGNRPFQNLGIESVTIPNTIFEQGRPFTIRARIGNYTKMDAKNHVVSVFLNGTRVAQRGVDIRAEKTADVEFQVTPSSAGFLEGFVEVEDDDPQYDNRRYFTFHIPDRISVLLVGNSAELRYIRLALQSHLTEGNSSIDIKEARAGQLSANQLNAADVVILSSSDGFSPALADQLGSFLRAGGGLIFFPTSQIQPSTFNQSLAFPLKLPAITGMEGSQTKLPPPQDGSFVEFERVEIQHPLFQGIFEESKTPAAGRTSAARKQQRSVESPKIRASIRYAMSPQSTQIMTLSNRTAFLVEQPVGDGRALLFSVPANLDWSDFPVRGLFVPLLHRSVMYLSQGQQRLEPEIAGNDHIIKSRIRSTEQWIVENPEKTKIALTPSWNATETNAHFSDTDVLGVYIVRTDNTVIQQFVVNLDPAESNVSPADQAMIDTMLRRLGIARSAVTTIAQTNEMQRLVLQSRFGVELWRHFLIAALVLALIEMFVARERRRAMIRESM